MLVSGRAQFVAHIGQEILPRGHGGLGPFAGLGQGGLGLDLLGDISFVGQDAGIARDRIGRAAGGQTMPTLAVGGDHPIGALDRLAGQGRGPQRAAGVAIGEDLGETGILAWIAGLGGRVTEDTKAVSVVQRDQSAGVAQGLYGAMLVDLWRDPGTLEQEPTTAVRQEDARDRGLDG